jgi:hypothetical protein
MKHPLRYLAIAGFCLLSSIHVPSIAASSSAPPVPRGNLARELNGTWLFVENIGQKQVASGRGRLMVFTEKHWLITQPDPRTHEVIFHHGGTYTLQGDELATTVEYAMQNTRDYIGSTRLCRIKIEGDTLTKEALDGNPFSEVWKRAR